MRAKIFSLLFLTTVILAFLVFAVAGKGQEAAATNVTLQERVTSLEKENAMLEQKIEALAGGIVAIAGDVNEMNDGLDKAFQTVNAREHDLNERLKKQENLSPRNQ